MSHVIFLLTASICHTEAKECCLPIDYFAISRSLWPFAICQLVSLVLVRNAIYCIFSDESISDLVSAWSESHLSPQADAIKQVGVLCFMLLQCMPSGFVLPRYALVWYSNVFVACGRENICQMVPTWCGSSFVWWLPVCLPVAEPVSLNAKQGWWCQFCRSASSVCAMKYVMSNGREDAPWLSNKLLVGPVESKCQVRIKFAFHVPFLWQCHWE